MTNLNLIIYKIVLKFKDGKTVVTTNIHIRSMGPMSEKEMVNFHQIKTFNPFLPNN